MHELELEQADVAEIDNCDQDYLQELKSEIAEQECVSSITTVTEGFSSIF